MSESWRQAFERQILERQRIEERPDPDAMRRFFRNEGPLPPEATEADLAQYGGTRVVMNGDELCEFFLGFKPSK